MFLVLSRTLLSKHIFYEIEVLKMSKLSEEQITVYLRKLPKWKHENDTIRKTFQFPDFTKSIAFVNKVAELAERSNHHPDIIIRFNKVSISLTTHDERGITGKDFSLAQQIESVQIY
jgi:4a-hydroxytetrahydrobiopterin dehydratase